MMPAPQNFQEIARYNMIEQQIRPWDVLDQKVLNALEIVPREKFVPKALQSLAFADMALPYGQGVGQCMLEPKLEARLIQELRITTHSREGEVINGHKPLSLSALSVLVVGAGTGYVAALIGHFVKSVLAFEIDPAIATIAQNNLANQHINNVHIVVGDPIKNPPSQTFDRILLTGSVAEIPETLLHLLNPNGLMIAVLGQEPTMCAVMVNAANHHPVVLFDTAIAPLVVAKKPAFVF